MNLPFAVNKIKPQKVVAGRFVFDTTSEASYGSTVTNASSTIVTFDSQQGVTDVAVGAPNVTITILPSEPLIPGTSIPLYRISALFDGGMTERQVKEDFPSLSASQISLARNYAQRYPNTGRPYPSQSLKRLLRNSGFAEVERKLKKARKAFSGG
jgi:uncharacterized protein (DUF433 family)